MRPAHIPKARRRQQQQRGTGTIAGTKTGSGKGNEKGIEIGTEQGIEIETGIETGSGTGTGTLAGRGAVAAAPGTETGGAAAGAGAETGGAPHVTTGADRVVTGMMGVDQGGVPGGQMASRDVSVTLVLTSLSFARHIRMALTGGPPLHAYRDTGRERDRSRERDAGSRAGAGRDGASRDSRGDTSRDRRHPTSYEDRGQGRHSSHPGKGAMLTMPTP
jgi:hypothetical protein